MYHVPFEIKTLFAKKIIEDANGDWTGDISPLLGTDGTLPRWLAPVWPGLVIFCPLGNHSKLVAIITLPKSPTSLGNFCKGVKIIHFLVNSFWAIFIHIWRFLSDHTAGSSLSISGSPCWTLKQHVLWQNILRGHIPSKMEGQPFQFVDL